MKTIGHWGNRLRGKYRSGAECPASIQQVRFTVLFASCYKAVEFVDDVKEGPRLILALKSELEELRLEAFSYRICDGRGVGI
jgi:hypothetical protein